MPHSKFFRIFFGFLFSLVVVSCSGDDDNPGSDLPRSAEDVREDFSKLNFQTGTNDFELESTVEGYYWDFRLIVPEGVSQDNKRPLVLNLHGAARSGIKDAYKSTGCLVEPAFEGKDVFILSPNSNGLLWYEEPNVIQILALLDLVKENFPIDLRKIVVTGYSDGGNGSWFFAQYYGDLFTAAIPMASSYNTKNTSGTAQKINVPLYVIHGSDDELFPIEITENFVNESIEAGSAIVFKVADGLSHNESCNYLSYMNESVEWLYTQVWN